MSFSKLLNRKAIIISDNECYTAFFDKPLKITHVARSIEEHPGYDNSIPGEALCDFEVASTGEQVPFSLYEYEFKLI